MGDRPGEPADAASPPPFKWTRLMASDSDREPEPRTGHAMTLLEPSKSVLMFGGSTGETLFDEVYVLEPSRYAAPETPRSKGKKKAKSVGKSGEVSGDAPAGDQGLPSFEWKKLLITRASKGATMDATLLASSFNSDLSSDSPRQTSLSQDDYLGRGRDFHTMHYVSSDDEKKRGFRVLVLGNVVLDVDGSTGGGESQDTEFDKEEMRLDEFRVKQPLLQGEWIPRTIKSMWKPCARNGHCSALVGDQLFCFGGKNVTATAYYGDFFYFDIAINQWREVSSTGAAPCARAFADMTVGATQDHLFVYGGNNLERQFGGLFMFDVRSSRWDKIVCLGDKPDTRINHSLTHIAPNYLVLFGGRKSATRQNDLVLCDLSTQTWRLLGGKTTSRSHVRRSRRNLSQSESQQTGQNSSTQSTSSSSNPVVSVNEFPSRRTAHSAILYGSANGLQQILVFGGYAGSHTWLNDLHVLELTPVNVLPPQESRSKDSSVSLVELAVARKASPRPHSSGSSSATARSSSRSSIEGGHVLSDITNIAQPKSEAGTTSPMAKTATSYTPAAVAARRRRLAEVEAKRNTPSTKKKRLSSGSAESSSQSQNSSEGQSQPKEFVGVSVSEGRSSSPELVGLQTTMIQILQQQQRMDHNLARLTSIVRDERSSSLREMLTSQQVFMQQQNELLENKLDAMTKRYEELEKNVELLSKEKHVFQEQLVAAETEIYMYKKTLEELIPQLGAQVLEAAEKSGRSTLNAIRLLEAKISSIHDMLEDIRHLSGERTETDDSPQKKDSMFSDDSSSSHPTHDVRTHTPAVLYPQTVVRELEEKLHDVVQENQKLHQRVAILEDELKTADGNAERIHKISGTWLRKKEQEESKGE